MDFSHHYAGNKVENRQQNKKNWLEFSQFDGALILLESLKTF